MLIIIYYYFESFGICRNILSNMFLNVLLLLSYKCFCVCSCCSLSSTNFCSSAIFKTFSSRFFLQHIFFRVVCYQSRFELLKFCLRFRCWVISSSIRCFHCCHFCFSSVNCCWFTADSCTRVCISFPHFVQGLRVADIGPLSFSSLFQCSAFLFSP